MRKRRAVLAVCLAILIAGPCLAGARPHIERVEPPNPFAGGVVEVFGTNFSEVLEEVRASVGGEPAIVLEPGIEHLRIMVPPGLRDGPQDLELAIGKEKPESSNKFGIKIRPEKERDAARPKDSGIETVNTLSQLRLIQLDAPEAMSDRGSLKVPVSGAAQLPDGCNLELTLKLGSEAIATIQAQVKDGRFAAAFGPYRKALFAGNYWVDAEFVLAEQSKRIKDLFRQTFRDDVAYRAHARGRDRQFCRIGTSADERTEDEELRRHIALSMARVRALLGDLELAYAGAGRSGFRGKDGKVDEGLWLEWLSLRSLVSVPPADRPAHAKRIQAKARFLGAEGDFLEPAWREWLDHKLRPDLNQLAKDHMVFTERYLVIKYADAMLRLEELYSMLNNLSRLRSRELYARNGIPFARQDEGGEGDVLKLGTQTVSPAHLEIAMRQISRMVNLTPAEQSAAAEAAKEEQK